MRTDVEHTYSMHYQFTACSATKWNLTVHPKSLDNSACTDMLGCYSIVQYQLQSLRVREYENWLLSQAKFSSLLCSILCPRQTEITSAS